MPTWTGLCPAILLLWAAAAAASPAGGDFRGELTPAGVYWTVNFDYEAVTLTVAGRYGVVAGRSFEAGEEIFFDLTDDRGDPLPDGRYTAELRGRERLSPERRELIRGYRETGDYQYLRGLERSGVENLGVRVHSDSFVIRNGSLALVEAADAEPDPFFPRASAGVSLNDWEISDSVGSDLEMRYLPGGQVPLEVENGAGDHSLSVAASGNVGLGTSTPARALHIQDAATPAIRFSDTSQTWDLGTDVGANQSFFVRDNNAGTVPFSIEAGASEGAVRVAADGSLGLGTDAPQAPLHVSRSDGTARVYVTERSGTTAQRNLFQLENNGGPLFVLKNSNSNVTWFFSMNPNDDFQFTLSGTGGAELLVRQNGRVQMGPGPEVVFDLLPNGNLTIAGTLTENSDRETKENLRAVDPARVLERVAQLPLFEWNRAGDPGQARHLGPTAQDFHALFGLGADDRHIATIDASGVALAAVQGLYHRVRRQQAEMEALSGLREENARLRTLVERLSRRLERLERAEAAKEGRR